ncbi:MAG: hypothetical protein M1609_12245, partial [Firmicutes bacterium]|nr:hypothetical protein [Bacillota bacterium]
KSEGGNFLGLHTTPWVDFLAGAEEMGLKVTSKILYGHIGQTLIKYEKAAVQYYGQAGTLVIAFRTGKWKKTGAPRRSAGLVRLQPSQF